ncbi:AsmA family protein [Reyranella sp.]|uniref:AsmA family protein n=1 Tax=Reyranella sp. TaxID=1929291 RepID=UPI003D107C6A
MRLRLKPFLIIAAIVVPLLGAAYAVPRLLDVESYKPALADAVKRATGRELVIDGPLKLTLLPVPRVSARSVHFANAVGGTGAQMVEVRWIGASPSWSALLQGRVEIGRLILYKPVVVLEADADGVPNWEFKPGAGAEQAAGAPSEGLHLAVGKLDIVDGTLSYTNPLTKKTIRAEQVKATASVGSLKGPFSIDGTATVNGVPLSLGISVNAPRDDGANDAKLAVKVPNGHLSFDGRTSAIASDATISGQLEVTTGGLTEFIAALLRAIGEAMPAFDSSVVGSFAFTGGVEISPTRLAVNDFKASLGGDSAAGTLALAYGKQPSLQGKLSLRQVDLDKWLELLAQPGVFLPKTTPSTPPAKPATAAKPAAPTASLSPFPPQLGVDLDLDVGETTFRKGTIRDLVLALQVRNGAITVPRLEAVLPGEMLVQADAAVDAAGKGAGTFTLTGSKLRDTLAWLAIDASGVPEDKLHSLSVKGKAASTAGSVNVTDATLELDGQPAKGGGSLTFGPPFTLSATLDVDRFDLDAYMPKSSAPVVSAPADAVDAVPPTKPGAAPDKSTPKLQLKSRIAKLIYRSETLNGVEANGTVQGNLLTLDGVKVADLLGAKIDLKGSVVDFARQPRFDLTFNATMPDTEKLLAYAQLPKFINGKIGPSSASGGVAGTFDAFSLRNATVSMLGSTAVATGALKLGDAFSYDFSSFSLRTADAGRLIAVAAGRAPTTSVGAIGANGTLKGTDKQATFDGELDAFGVRTQGSLAATLGMRPNITVKWRVPGTFDVDQVLGVSADAPGTPATVVPAAGAAPLAIRKPGVATGKPIDLSGLKAFDATISLETSATSIASLNVTYADLEATLRNGVLKISKLTGQFYGGAVDFTGTVDASGQTVMVDMTGSLQGIYVGEMLRGTAGTNNFNNPNLSLSIDGKLSAMGIQLKAQGKSPEEIRDNLTATAGLSGYVYPAVTQGSIDFARFATSVGSIFSDDMAFISAMLRGFVNRQNPIQGQMSIGGGAVTLQNPTVTGAGTTATIAGSTSLTAATTDTVVSINSGNDQTKSDFVINVKGPLASPMITTGRGPSR